MQLLSLLKELSLHPKNAEELKGLILQLAVQGNLTAKWREDNPDVESASELLKRIDAEKKLLIKEKKIKKENPMPVISNDNQPYHLPVKWQWTRLNELASINGGFAFKSSLYVESGARVIRISDFNELGFKNDKVVRYIYTDELAPYVLEDKNILLAMTGGTVGKSLFVDTVDELMVVNQRVATIKIINPINEAYINCVIPTRLVQDVIEEAKNSTNDNISMSDIKGFMIPFPPLEEQKAIVEVVKQLFVEVEQLEALTKDRISLKEDFVTSALRRLTETDNTATEWDWLKDQFSTFFKEQSSVKKLRETILQLAVQGKLTAKWRANNPNLEPASELLKRIEAEKQQLIKEKKIKKEKPLPPIGEDEMPYELPEGWVWCRMINLNYDLHYGYTASAKSTYNGVGLLRITDIQNNKVNWQTVPDCDIKDKDLPKYLLSDNDILIARTGGTIGKSFLVKGVNRQAVFASYLIRAIPVKDANADYIKLFIESPLYWGQLYANSQGTGQPNVNATSLKGLITPLPPLEEQKAIVEKVNSLMALCDELEQQIETSHTQVEQLMQSCLKEVFETA